MRALVIGGTGPTGQFVVNGLLQRQYEVAILHRGGHEIPEIPPQVEHIHTDPYAKDCLQEALSGRHFDVCIASYGRLRAIAEVMPAHCDRLLSVGGLPALRGYMNPGLYGEAGMPLLLNEQAEAVTVESDDPKGWRIVKTEQKLFELWPDATHFRYPIVYGPYQLVPREWCIVRRILDKRPHIVLPDGGLSIHSFGYAENLAHAILLAVDQPQASKGKIYHCGDERPLTLRQVVDTIAEHMGHSWDVINMPWELAKPSRPLLMQPQTSHRFVDISRLKSDLGYRDVVSPPEALARTADWLCQHRPEPGGMEEQVLQDPFDYAAEDALIERWQRFLSEWSDVEWSEPPGVGLAYSGPGGRPRSQKEFQ